MADKQWYVDNFGTAEFNGRTHYLKDGDTWADLETDEEYRAVGIDTEEILHPGTDEFKGPMTNVGYGQSVMMSDLIKKGGFTEQEDMGTDKYGRTLSQVINPETENTLSNRLYSEGIITPNEYTSQADYDAYVGGNLARHVLGSEADDSDYADARETLKALRQADELGFKRIAVDEREFSEAPWLYDRTMYRRPDRTIDNKALSPFSSGFGAGVDSLQSGFYGVMDMIGARLDIKTLSDYGKAGVESNQIEIENQPTWVNKIQDVDSVGDFAEWSSGALGGSLPYFMLMGAGFLPVVGPVAQVSLGLTYAGQTWNDMEGKDDKKSASIALTSGIAMAMFDRLGGSFVLKGLKPQDLLDDKGVRKAIIQLAKNKDIPYQEAGRLIRRAREQEVINVLKDFKQNALLWKVYASKVGKSTASGILAESGTEALQEATQYTGAYLGSEAGLGKFDTEEFRDLLVNAAAAGGLLGGAVQGGISTIQETSPYHTGFRQKQWERQKAIESDLENPYSIKEILDEAVSKQIKPLKDEEGNIVTDEKNQPLENDQELREKAEGWVEQGREQKKQESTFNRVFEGFTQFKWLSTGYQVLRKKLGDYAKGSKTLLSEFDFSGWVGNRAAYGMTLPQLRRSLEGVQHAALHRVTTNLAKAFGFPKINQKNRKAAYQILLDYLNQVEVTEDPELQALVFDETNLKDPDLIARKKEIRDALNEIRDVEKEIVKKTQKFNKNFAKDPLFLIKQNRLDLEKVEANKAKFIGMLVSNYGMTKDEAIEEVEKVLNTPEGYEPNQFKETDFLTKKPGFFKMTDYHSPIWKEFHEENNLDSAFLKATEAANYLTDMWAMGFNGKRLNAKLVQIHQELSDAHGEAYADEVMPEIAQTIYDHYRAHRGEYNKIKNDKVRTAMSNISALMSLAYMPLAVFASIPEIGLAFAKADLPAVIKAMKYSAKVGAQAMAAQMNKIADTNFSTEDYDNALNNLRERGMLTHEYAAGHVVDATYGNDRRNWLQREMMPFFYRITGLTSFTSAVRVIRDSVGNDFIGEQIGILEQVFIRRKKEPGYEMNNKEARAFKMLKELGVDPFFLVRKFREVEQNMSDVPLDTPYARNQFKEKFQALEEIMLRSKQNSEGYIPELKAQLEEAESEAERQAIKDKIDAFRNNVDNFEKLKKDVKQLSDAIDLARGNFVDASLVNPDAGRRPLFYSDGRFRLLTLFQGYLSVFSATIIRPILRDMAGKGAPVDQINAASMLLTMIGLGFLGQAIKDEIKYGDKPSWLTDAQYLQRGIQASGIMGQTERIFNLFFPLYHSKGDTLADKAWAEIGPLTSTFDTAAKGIQYATEGKSEEALNKFLKIAPGGSITQMRREIANILAGDN